jgi:glycosyltransferase involved in cell wall biosynthesis
VLKKHDVNVIYGGGPHGVLAANLIGFISIKCAIPIVSRFYGTFLAEKILLKRYVGIILNWDEWLAFRLSKNAVIITDDGTRGNMAMQAICPKRLDNMHFWVNGVDPSINRSNLIRNNFDAITICRLVSWKRVDRALVCVSKIVNEFGLKKFKYHIVGDGPELPILVALTKKLKLNDNVIFHGALRHAVALELLYSASIYISTYDLSNVGNPLLEAIRANKLIFTLNNGDTSSWIDHGVNGFIYDIDDSTEDRMAQDMVALTKNPLQQDTIRQNIRVTEMDRLWTWDERLHAEISVVEKLVEGRS